MYQTLQITVPGIPPSVNHYKTYVPKAGRYLVSKEAKAFKWSVATLAAGRRMVDSKAYYCRVIVYLGYRQRGDAGNFEKCIGDGLQDAGVFPNDSRVKHYEIFIDRDRENPRTEITIEAMRPGPPKPQPKGENFVSQLPRLQQGIQGQQRACVAYGDGAPKNTGWRAVAARQIATATSKT